MSRKQNSLSRSECISILKDCLSYLQDNYGVSSLAIFGSIARSQNRESSDVDILIRFTTCPSLFTYIRIENYLSSRLNARVDLISEDSIKPSFEKRIQKDIIRI